MDGIRNDVVREEAGIQNLLWKCQQKQVKHRENKSI
jgi:hypothetical protein